MLSPPPPVFLPCLQARPGDSISAIIAQPNRTPKRFSEAAKHSADASESDGESTDLSEIIEKGGARDESEESEESEEEEPQWKQKAAIPEAANQLRNAIFGGVNLDEVCAMAAGCALFDSVVAGPSDSQLVGCA